MPASASRFFVLLRELRRRRVYRAAAVYGAAAFVVLQAADLLVAGLHLPSWVLTLTVVLSLLGLPVVLVLAWVFQLVPPGLRREVPATAPSPLPLRVPRVFGGALLLVLLGVTGFVAYARIGGGASGGERSIAVLPFVNLDGNPESEYFSDGITEDVLTQLAKIGGLRVISRTSVMHYKGSDVPLRQVSDELGARYVIEGSVRRAAGRLRVVAQLIDARRDEHLWAETYDREERDVFRVQSEIAGSIAKALHVRITGEERERLTSAPTGNTAAYDLFLEAREYSYRFEKEANEVAIALSRQALAIDPAFAPAWALLGTTYAYKVLVGDSPEWGDSAMVAAQRAITLDPDLAEGHRALGNAYLRLGRYPDALRAYRRATELNPSDWRSTVNTGTVYSYQGEPVEAIRWTRQAISVDPQSPLLGVVYQNLATYYLDLSLLDLAEGALDRARVRVPPDHPKMLMIEANLALHRGDWRRAIERGERMAAAVPTDASAQLLAGDAHLFAGDRARARLYYERAYRLSADAEGIRHFGAVLLGYVLWHAGERTRAAQLFQQFEALAEREIAEGSDNYTIFLSLAGIASIRGDDEAALRWVRRSLQTGGASVGWCLEHDPLLEQVRRRPEYGQIVREVNAAMERARRRVLRDGS